MSHIIALQLKEGFLSQDPSAISGQVPVRSDYPEARYDDADRIMADRAANCLRRHPFDYAFFCDLFGDPTVRNGLSKRNLAHDLSDSIAEIGSYQMDSREKARIAA